MLVKHHMCYGCWSYTQLLLIIFFSLRNISSGVFRTFIFWQWIWLFLYFSKISDFLQSMTAVRTLKIACILSLLTVCLYTPKTVQYFWPLTYIVFALDLFSTTVLSVEAVVRINIYKAFRVCFFLFFFISLLL